MPEYQYLVIGGGMTADAAVHGIRQVDPAGTIGLISSEQHPPYNRPPLSKALWKGQPLESIWRKGEKTGVEMLFGRTAMGIDAAKKRVTDDRGESYGFTKLLLATGGSVRRLPWDVEGMIYFRTLEDYQALRSLADRRQSFAVIGGGFIGSEIAAALAMNGRTVTMIVPEEHIGARIYPSKLAKFLNGYYGSKGVTVLANESVDGIERRGESYRLRLKSGKQISADGVVAGIGIQPNVDLARAAGLVVDNGIHVDEFLRTRHPDIFAAGDVANFYNPALDRRIRVEHEDNANTMGETAGKNMAGQMIPYHHLPFFYSDLFDLGYEAVGELVARMEIVEDWKEEFKEGVIYYLREGRVRGVLLWNTWGQVDEARKLIAAKESVLPEKLKRRLPVTTSA